MTFGLDKYGSFFYVTSMIGTLYLGDVITFGLYAGDNTVVYIPLCTRVPLDVFIKV